MPLSLTKEDEPRIKDRIAVMTSTCAKDISVEFTGQRNLYIYLYIVFFDSQGCRSRNYTEESYQRALRRIKGKIPEDTQDGIKIIKTNGGEWVLEISRDETWKAIDAYVQKQDVKNGVVPISFHAQKS
jgi:hypothetical protein